jgi:hypothetical protein
MANLELHNLSGSISYLEAKGLSKIFDAYTEISSGEISEIGFNPNSGYTYIALENGISICSELGQEVEYLITDFETGTEAFYGSYEEAQEAQEKLNNPEVDEKNNPDVWDGA